MVVESNSMTTGVTDQKRIAERLEFPALRLEVSTLSCGDSEGKSM